MTSETTTTSTSAGEMPSAPYSDEIALSETDHSRLYMFIHSRQQSARARTRAQVLLKLVDGWSLAEVCRAFDVCRNTVVNVRARFAEAGWMPCCAISRKSAIAKRSRDPAGTPHRYRLQQGPGWTRPLDTPYAG